MTRKLALFFVALVLLTGPSLKAADEGVDVVAAAVAGDADNDEEDGYEGDTAGPVPEPEISEKEFSSASLRTSRYTRVDAPSGESRTQVEAPQEPHDPTHFAEALYRPGRGRISFTLAPASTNEVQRFAGGRREVKTQMFGIHTDAGLTETLALGFETDYGQVDEQSNISSGFSDLNFKGQAGWKMGDASRFTMGLVYSYSFDAHQEAGVRLTGRRMEGNRLSGGDSVTPSLALQFGNDTKLGLKLSYQFHQERRSVGAFDGSETFTRGGDTTRADVFVEGSSVGLGLFHASQAETNMLNKGIQTRVVPLKYAGASLYGMFDVSRSLTIKPMISYMTIPDKTRTSTTKFDQYDVTTGMIAARLTL